MPGLLDERTVRMRLSEPGVWPDLSQAAGIVGLAKSTLSKRATAGQIEYEVLGLGRGRHVVSPWEVLRIGIRYRRVPEHTLMERLARFLSPRLGAEARIVYRVLSCLLHEVDAVDGLSMSPEKSEAASWMESSNRHIDATCSDVPAWLMEVDELRGNPIALAGALSFVSPDDTIGQISPGPTIDDVAGVVASEPLVR